MTSDGATSGIFVLNITIARIGKSGFNAKGHQGIDIVLQNREPSLAVLINSSVSRMRLSAGAAIITASGSFFISLKAIYAIQGAVFFREGSAIIFSSAISGNCFFTISTYSCEVMM